MFTGLIQAVATIIHLEPMAEGLKISITRPEDFNDIVLGESIALNGVCMTVVAFDASSFSVEASHETLAKTSLGKLSESSVLNLERALLPTDRLGGHFVSGHVDALASIVSITDKGMARDFVFKLPSNSLQPYLIPKGSVALDGISLTVNWVNELEFGVTIIPHTWKNTTLGDLKAGDTVNIETDMLGKYIVQNMKLVSPGA